METTIQPIITDLSLITAIVLGAEVTLWERITSEN